MRPSWPHPLGCCPPFVAGGGRGIVSSFDLGEPPHGRDMDLSDPVFDSKAGDVFLVLAVAEGNELAFCDML
jgi:hypothetical protein